MFSKAPAIKDDTTAFVIFSENEEFESLISADCITVSIDPAPKNFALRIERRTIDDVVTTIYMDRMDFSNYGDASESTGTTTVDPKMLRAILEYIDSLEPWIRQAQVIAIERQMSVNYKATKIFQHLITYFMIKIPTYDGRCLLIDISPKLKGKMLGAPSGLNYNGLKAWGVKKAIEIMEQRGDEWSLSKIKKQKGKTVTKADDLADTIIQMEAWFKLVRS